MTEAKFWDKVHQDNSKLWLTCSKPENVFKIHGLPIPEPGTKILDIGIGDGSMHRFLQKAGGHVWSTDISDIALARVGCRGIRESGIQVHGPWDLVLCHLVFQHMDLPDIKQLISRIKLRESGIFSFQFAELINESDGQWTHHYFRDLETMENLILSLGFRILYIRNPSDWPWEGSLIRWWVMRVWN
jgi:SAM-dependent methyltransferase